MDASQWIALIGTIIGGVVAGIFSWQLGKYQANKQLRGIELVNKTTGETEFRDSLLQLIDQQEERITNQDKKIERQDRRMEELNAHLDKSTSLVRELKRANLDLVLENNKLTDRIRELERELHILQDSLRKLTQDGSTS